MCYRAEPPEEVQTLPGVPNYFTPDYVRADKLNRRPVAASFSVQPFADVVDHYASRHRNDKG